jgi:glycosyltransferase involved in cell wall biosynthesis
MPMAEAASPLSASPLVTIVLPTYNRRLLLGKAVDSIRKQTYGNWELIVVDDGSTDGSLEGLPRDPRIHAVRLPHTANLARVRNTGLEAARGELIAFIDSDDTWQPEKLALQIARMQARPDADWCFCFYQLVDEVRTALPLRAGRPTTSAEGNVFAAVLDGSAGISMATVMVRRDMALRVRFDERVPFGEDFDFLIRLARCGVAACVPTRLVDVLHHVARTTQTRYDQSLHLAAAFRRYRRDADDASVRDVCRREAFRFTKQYLSQARQRGRLLFGLVAAARMWASGNTTI